MKRLRPSLRKLEKAERAAGGTPYLYEVHRAAVTRVLDRLGAALDRIRVAAEFTEFSGSTVAQLQHAQRFIEEGTRGVDDEWFTVADGSELVITLAHLYHDALVAELLARAHSRDVGESEGAAS